MVAKTISNRVNRSLQAAILLSDLFFFRLFLFENILRRLCAGLVLQRRILEYFPFGPKTIIYTHINVYNELYIEEEMERVRPLFEFSSQLVDAYAVALHG